MAEEQFVIAPHAVEDPTVERKVYGAGDRVPMADAVKYGLVPKPKGKRARKPTEDRMRRPAEDR